MLLLVKLHGEVCLKVLIGKHFFCYFMEKLDTQLKAH